MCDVFDQGQLLRTDTLMESDGERDGGLLAVSDGFEFSLFEKRVGWAGAGPVSCGSTKPVCPSKTHFRFQNALNLVLFLPTIVFVCVFLARTGTCTMNLLITQSISIWGPCCHDVKNLTTTLLDPPFALYHPRSPPPT